MRHVYVYYRVDLTKADLAGDQIDTLLLTMARHCGQPPHRMHRCDDPTTWMESYPAIADIEMFSKALGDAVLDLECTQFILGERHLECFVPPIPNLGF
ncbi:MAG: DUF4936 domain-containing protein [Hydrogenophilales bacterium 17-62-8]|nr:MAG: DUF4936 domain-containing protein [Hydrogenophilales bacterium 17-62-8]